MDKQQGAVNSDSLTCGWRHNDTRGNQHLRLRNLSRAFRREYSSSPPTRSSRCVGIPPSAEVWPRVVGTLTLVLALYFISAARQEVTPFFRWTVYARVFVFVSFTLYVLLGFAGLVLILFGLVDLLGAIWTGWALRSSKPSTA